MVTRGVAILMHCLQWMRGESFFCSDIFGGTSGNCHVVKRVR